MKRWIIIAAFAAAALLSYSSRDALRAQQPAGAVASAPSEHQALINQYCVTCHNQRAKTAGLTFDTMNLGDVGRDAKIWEEAVRKLRGGMMPPPGARQPERAAVKSFVSWLETTLDRAGAEQPGPGHVALHRMNRTEYANAVEEIFGFHVASAALLPEDDISDGFDNIASVLKVSPSFLDQYISAARAVTAQAMGNSSARPVGQVYRASNADQSVYIEGQPLGTRGGMLIEHTFPADGEYVFDIGNLATAGYVLNMDFRHRVILTIDGLKVFEASLGGEPDLKAIDQQQAPAVESINARFKKIKIGVKAGVHKVGVTFVARSFGESDAVLEPFAPGGGVDRIPRISQLQITGPYSPSGVSDTPSRQRVLICTPAPAAGGSDELACATKILRNIARQAYRRPVTDEDLASPLSFFKSARATGSFDAGIESALTLILSSPKFLYRTEEVPGNARPGETFPINDLELASRLSFFLWSQGPDEELLETATSGKLRSPGALEKQMRRLLSDPKSHALAENFAFQWLNLRAIREFAPDPVIFPNFDDSLKTGFERELDLFIGSIIDEDRNVMDLLTADHTFVNEKLALHYGIPNVRGDRFRRVTLSDPNRFGLLGKGGVLMVTSYPNRTAAVLRGAWILERVLGTPPAAPPPDVEAFKENVEGEKALTVRERMEAHRENPSCKSCHIVMDPLGFALENFDALGAWRATDRYSGTAIDAAGQLVDGTRVNNPAELRRALSANPEQFVQTLTERLLMYALGRSVEYHDMPLVRKIVRDSARNGYRFSSIVKGIVDSAPFQQAQVARSARAEN
jgi:mono/diheme cytochrome c family protein